MAGSRKLDAGSLLHERPDRPGGRLEPGLDANGLPPPRADADDAWDRSLASALESFDSEQDEALDRFDSEHVEPPAVVAPRVIPPPPPEPAPPFVAAGPSRPPSASPVAPPARDLFGAGQEDGGPNRLLEVAASAAAAASRLTQTARSKVATARAARAAKAAKAATATPALPHAAARPALPPAAAPPRQEPATGKPLRRWTLVAAIAVAAIALGLAAWFLRPASTGAADGALTVTSKPSGAAIVVDGQPQGVTPATLRVAPGLHTLEVRSGGPAQIASVRVGDGGQLSRFFELAAGTSGATLQVTSKPAGGVVTIDGRPRGRTPVTVTDLNPGAHRVRVKRGAQSAERLIMLESGANGTVSLPLDTFAGAPTEGHGWLDVSIPVDAQAYEADKLIGSTRSGPWQLTAGRHELSFVNQGLGVQATQVVQVEAGRTVSLDVSIPTARLSITTTPVANIFLDGEPLGAAPIASRPLTAGQHDVVARHPVLGERRLMVTVIAGVPLAIAVDLRR